MSGFIFHTGDLLSLPSIASLTTEIADAVSQRRSTVVYTGRFMDPEQYSAAVCGSPQLRDFYIIETTARSGVAPSIASGEAFDVRGGNGDRVVDDPAFECDPWRVAVVKGLDDCCSEDIANWFVWLARWADASRARSMRGEFLPPMLLCLRGSDSVKLPPNGILFGSRALYRATSELDVRVLVRRRNSERTIEQAWREFVLPSLVGNDLEMLDALWSTCLRGIDEIEVAIHSIGRERGWCGPPQTKHSKSRLAEVADELGGRAHWTPERGLEWNAAWQAACGNTDIVARRLWRGQAGYLLPLLDGVRMEVADRLEKLLSAGWAVRFPPESLEEKELVARDYRSAQFSHMLSVVQGAGIARREKRELDPVLRQARSIRNELAHYRPVHFELLRKLQTSAREAGMTSFG
jgi:hypothetical protein